MIRPNTAGPQQALSAITATGVGNPFSMPLTDYDSIVFGLFLSAVTGTSPTLDLYLQTLGVDGNWYDVYHWAQQTGTTTAANQIFVQAGVGSGSRLIGTVGSKTISANTLGVDLLSNTFRLAYTVGGTSPSFTGVVNSYINTVSRPN